MFCACVFVWMHRFCIVIYKILFSHRARRLTVNGPGESGGFHKFSIEPARLFLWEISEWMTFEQRKKFQTMLICVKSIPMIFVTHLCAKHYVVTERKGEVKRFLLIVCVMADFFFFFFK